MRSPLLSLLFIAPALAIDIEGVQMAAMDQPRVSVTVRRAPGGEPLFAKTDPALGQLLGIDKDASDKSTTFAAFLDTGASGISISTQTADSLGIQRAHAPSTRQRVVFHDIGVGGTDQFNISEPLHFTMGHYQSLGITGGAEVFPGGGPWPVQIGPLGGGGLLGMLTGGIDIVGMPVMAGRIIAMDVRPVNKMEDTIRVHIVDPRRDRTTLIPKADRHVLLSYSDFTAYTTIEPADARRPITIANPFIGPSPLPLKGSVAPKPITLKHRGKQTTGGWLLDTGAAASMISKKSAAELGIRYKPGSENSGSPELVGVPADKQFTLTIGGIGGQKKCAGFSIDEMRIATVEGDELIYKPGPVLVADITVTHPQTKQQITLDGIFGMNFLVASAQVTGGLLPDIGKISEGAFDWVIVDNTRGVLGLVLRKDLK